MFFLFAWFIGIAATIGAVIASIASIIVTVCAAVASTIAWVAGAVVGLFAGIGAGILSSLGILSSEVAIGIGTSLGAISDVAATMYFTAGAWIESLVTGFKTFLQIIHFDTLKKIHDIAYLVSSDYREYMNEVYAKIGEFSEAISGDAFFAVQLIENARAVVLDTSSMLGRSYDIGELTWLAEFQELLKTVHVTGEKYADNPYLLIDQINEVVMKPAHDLQTTVWQGVYETIDGTLEVIDGTIQDIVVIQKDLEKLWTDLPPRLTRRFDESINKINRLFDEFIDKKYHPALDRLKVAINTLEGEQSGRVKKIDDLVERLKTPGKYLKEIDELPEGERLKEYEIVADYSTRIYRQPVQAWRQFAKPYTEEFLKIGEVTTKARVRPQWEVPEVTRPSAGKPIKSGGSQSPFPEDV